MRQRRVRGIDERLAAYADLILRAEGGAGFGAARPEAALRWYQRVSPRYEIPGGYGRVYVEFGCGRGCFINALAAADPGGLYIGVEGCKTIIISALEKTRSAKLRNARYIDAFVNDAASAFADGALAGIFLNFSDPWPKDRHQDRRLTAPAKAESYFRIIAPNGFAAFKTDHEAFFDYSLESFAGAGFQITSFTRDLAACEARFPDGADEAPDVAACAAAARTEYEQRFRSLGQPIYHFIARRP